MEHSKDPVSVRTARITSQIIGQNAKMESSCLLSREVLLDALIALYEECSLENLQKYDANIRYFVERYQKDVKEIKQLRVNVTDFEIKNIIGRGHFGEVHLVKEKQTGDIYAMKTLRKFHNDLQHMSFEEERNIMAHCNSPWLTSLQYSFQDNTYLFFVMEYHPGGDLLGLLYRQGGTLPESAVTFYIAELVLALEDLHKMGYIHRDIKPDNILLDRCGHLKLADFGSSAKLNADGLVTAGPPVGTPDYVAPEVLQCLDNKNADHSGYGVSCDFWSLGILAYELTIGVTPFTGQNSASIYAKIINHNNTLTFPSDVVLTQAFINFVKSLITDQKSRINLNQIRRHDLFKGTEFETLREQVPPYVPNITSIDDTSHFSDIHERKKDPNIENFKKRTQFSGRNLPFVGFTFTHDPNCFESSFKRKVLAKDEVLESLKNEVESLRKKLVENEGFCQDKDLLTKKLDEKDRKLGSIQSLCEKLERELACNIAECTALKRTLELERKDRSELEKKALNLIRTAKQAWQTEKKNNEDALISEIEQYKEKNNHLMNTNKILNEQLQHALKLEDNHRESLEKVQNLSRRSVIGLESRLEKVTSETQDTISELRKKLTDEIHQNKLLDAELCKAEAREAALTEQLKSHEKDLNNWKEKIDEAQNVIIQLNKQITILEKDLNEVEQYKEQIKKLQEKVDNSHKSIKELENRNTFLQLEKNAMESQKKELDEMKELIKTMQNDKKVSELENQLIEEKQKCMSLQRQLQDFENISTENQELRELRTKYWRADKELSNFKIDKRILERELKDSKIEIKALTEKIANFGEVQSSMKKVSESALLELSNINENLTLELIKMKDSYSNLEEKLKIEQEKTDGEKHHIHELKNLIKMKDDQLYNLNIKLNNIKETIIICENKIKRHDIEKGEHLDLVNRLQKEKNDAIDELEKSNRKIKNINLNLNALREATTLLENQVIEYEKINKSYESKHAALNDNIDKLIQDLCKAKHDIQDAKKYANEEKSLKILLETKLKCLNEDIECLQNECTSYKQQCMEYKQFSASLSEELTITEEKNYELKLKIKSLERQTGDLRTENKVIKQELSDYLTQLNKLKELNYKLKSQLKELQDDKAVLIQKLTDTERILNEKNNFYEEREMKSDSTIKQQIKLIDYLQIKINELNKKRTVTEVLFGSSKKENHPPVSLTMNYKDLERQLLKEKQKNKQLNEEIYKLKAMMTIHENKSIADKIKVQRHSSEVLSPKSKIAIEQIVNSPSKQKNDLYRQNSVQRMCHNIPHRYESKLCTKPSMKCFGCSESISLGRSIHVCSECSINVHTHCLKLVPNTCGLPQIFAKHYKDSLQPKNDNLAERWKSDENINVEGWIKIPGKTGGWEKHYACLTDTAINIYTAPLKDKSSSLHESFDLKPADSHGKVILEPLPSEIGIPVANSDLAFILKVEVSPNTTCWPPKCLIFLTLSAQEKDKWFLALQKFFVDDLEKPKFEDVLTLPEELLINCLVDLTDNIKVIGSEKGLYSFYEKKLVHIEGLEELHHISIMTTTNTVLMIADKKRRLIYCDLNRLINITQCAQCVQPKLKFSEINVKNLNSFHIVQTSAHPNNQKICVATVKQLFILDYDIQENRFVLAKILDTAEPTSCALFTENSLIVGANKFFEIDLTTFEAEEFLDGSDARLKHAESCYKMGSFPLAILQITKNPREYLLCFNEFFVFVDEYGRSTRKMEIKSTHLPLAFHFKKPYLYIVQFAAIAIMCINDETCNGDSNDINNLHFTRLEIDKFKFVGVNKDGIYIVCGRELRFVDARKIIDDDISYIASDTTDNESDRFSFSSSMVQSLDGNLSNTESLEEKDRRVRFSQTDL